MLQVDLVSDSERDNLIFVHLDIDETIEVRPMGPCLCGLV